MQANGLVLAVLAATAGVGPVLAAPPSSPDPPQAAKRSGAPFQVTSSNTGAMPLCNIKMSVVATVRAIIPKAFNPANAPRNVFSKAPAANEAQEDANLNYGTAVPGIYRNDPNPYHMDLRAISTIKAPDGTAPYAEVRLMLLDTVDYMGFYNLEGINGVGFGGGANTLGLCGAQFDTSTNPAPPFPVVFFFVPLNLPSGNQGSGTFNFGLFPRVDSDTPIFIDPKVINNG
jgi:hypothetical protein